MRRTFIPPSFDFDHEIEKKKIEIVKRKEEKLTILLREMRELEENERIRIQRREEKEREKLEKEMKEEERKMERMREEEEKLRKEKEEREKKTIKNKRE